MTTPYPVEISPKLLAQISAARAEWEQRCRERWRDVGFAQRTEGRVICYRIEGNDTVVKDTWTCTIEATGARMNSHV